MAPPLTSNQQLFDSIHFAGGGDVGGNIGDAERTLNPTTKPFPDDSVVLVTFNTAGDSITRLDIFDSQAAFDSATSLDDASASYWEQNTTPEASLDGTGISLQNQGDEGDSFVAFAQPTAFTLDGVNNGPTLQALSNANKFLFAPHVDLVGEIGNSVTIPVDLDKDGNSEFDANNIVCFAAGTMIATPCGQRAVETLEPGDLVMTSDGREVPVRWVGRQTVHKVFTPEEHFRPVRIEQGALGEALPDDDLVLTADHALVFDGTMINAGALVNGTTVTRVPMAELAERVTYYHVETEAHDVIVANGVPAETFVDVATRRVFDNYSEFVALYGDVEPSKAVLPMARAFSHRQVPHSVKARIADRSAVAGVSLKKAG